MALGSYLGLITARKGSRGLPDKHVRLLGGRPLIDWTFEAARASGRLTRTIISTNDDRLVARAVANGIEAPFVRPESLATDDASHFDVVRHALDWYRGETGGWPDAFVLLQPTSPFRTAEDIDNAVDTLERGAPAVVSVCECLEHPGRCYRMDDGRLRPYDGQVAPARRQDLVPAYRVNGAIYAMAPQLLMATRRFVPDETTPLFMPIERSVDIDTERDLDWAEFCWSSGRVQPDGRISG